MFSYSIDVRRINSNSKLKGIATVVVDDILELHGFKIIDGSKGLFVSVPSHKGSVMEDGVKVDKYFDDIRFKGESGKDFADELKQAIINSYNNASDPISRSKYSEDNANKKTDAANAKKEAGAPKASQDSSPPRARKPLWGF